MDTNKISESQLNDALCEVRKAHRLIYEYQRRMLDLTWFIKTKLDFPQYAGIKKYSNPISSRGTIFHDMWSWDFIYTYVFEYYLGEQADIDRKLSWKFCIIQVSDTGFYKGCQDEVTATNINSYASPEDSETRLLFYLSISPNSSEEYDWDPSNIINSYAGRAEAGQDEFYKIENPNRIGSVQIIYSVPLSRFLDEENTVMVLRKFVEYCNTNSNTKLHINE